MDDQEENIQRVRAKIGELILGFARARAAIGAMDFRADELRRYVLAAVPTAPDSAGRILRDLRHERKLDYIVVSRKDSHYRLLWVDVPPDGRWTVKGALVLIVCVFAWAYVTGMVALGCTP